MRYHISGSLLRRYVGTTADSCLYVYSLLEGVHLPPCVVGDGAADLPSGAWPIAALGPSIARYGHSWRGPGPAVHPACFWSTEGPPSPRIRAHGLGAHPAGRARAPRIPGRPDRSHRCGAYDDAQLDTALRGLARARRPVQARSYLLRYRNGIRRAYLDRLVASGVVRRQRGWITGTRWFIADQARVADARARLDAIALSPGQIDAAQAAYGSIAAAIGLLRFLYSGPAARPVRKRMSQVARGQWTAAVTTADGVRAMQPRPRQTHGFWPRPRRS